MARPTRFRTALLVSTALIASALASTATAQALPDVANAGGASISTAGGTMSIDLNGAQRVIDYNSFNVGAPNSVSFIDTLGGGDTAVLNRVIGGAASDIQGSIVSTPGIAVYLINPNGVLFGGNAVVNTGGFTASTRDVSNADFLDGDASVQFAGSTSTMILVASGASFATTGTGSANGVARTGDLVFIGPVSGGAATNATIQAAGNVAIVAADTVTVTNSAGSPLSLTIDAGTAVSGALKYTGSIEGRNVTVALATRGSVADTVLGLGEVTATGVSLGDRGIVLSAGAVPYASGVTYGVTADTLPGSQIQAFGAVSSGALNAPAVHVAAAGAVTTGAITAAGGGINIASPGAKTFGALTTSSAGDIWIDGPGAVTFNDDVYADNDLMVGGGTFTSTITANADLETGGLIDLRSTGALSVHNVASAGDVLLTGVGVAFDEVRSNGGSVGIGGGSGAVTGDVARAVVSLSITGGTLDLDEVGSTTDQVALIATGDVTVHTAADAATLYSVAGQNITLGGVQSAGGAVNINASNALTNTGALTLTANSDGVGSEMLSLQAGPGGISLGANTILNGGAARQSEVFILTNSTSDTLALGDINASTIRSWDGFSIVEGISRTASFTTGALTTTNPLRLIGEGFTTGALTTTGPASDIVLNSGTAGVGSIVTGAITSGRDVIVGDAARPLTFSSGAISGAEVTLRSAGDQTVSGAIATPGALTLVSSNGAIHVAAVSAASVDVTGASFAQTGAMDTGALHGATTGAFTATNAGNAIDVLGAVNAGGAFALVTSGDLAIGDQVSAVGAVSIRAGGDLTIQPTGQVASGVVQLSTAGAFHNARGADAIAAGQWLVYAAGPTGNTFGGLDSGQKAVWGRTIDTLSPAAVVGNRYVFAYQPTVTLTSVATSKTYGTHLTGTSVANGLYSVSGVQAGVANAYLADSTSDAFSGAPTVSSTGFAERASVAGGPYSVVLDTSGLIAHGYAIAVNNAGQITVTPKSINGAAIVDTKIYDGGTTGTGRVMLSGLLTGDVVAGSADFAFADKNAGAGKTVTVANGRLSGADAGNYALAPLAATTVADILQRGLTVAASPIFKAIDTPDPNLAYTLEAGSLVSGDALSGALIRQAGEDAGRYAIEQGTLTAGGNYKINFKGATFTITDRAQAPAPSLQPLHTLSFPSQIVSLEPASARLVIEAGALCVNDGECAARH